MVCNVLAGACCTLESHTLLTVKSIAVVVTWKICTVRVKSETMAALQK